MTRTAAVAENVPAVAVTEAGPVARNVVSVVFGPVFGASFPIVDGASDHDADAGTLFPYVSMPTAVSGMDARVRMVTDFGLITTEASGPGVTVSVCVPLVAPVADAVTIGLPAVVSR